MSEIITITNKRDLAFCAVAQYALVNNTTFPSGFVSPPVNMIIVDNRLIPANTKLRKIRVDRFDATE